MTEKYTPEKVAELVALAGSTLHVSKDAGTIDRLARALTAVTAERDAAQRKARMIPKRLRAERDRLHKAITEARKLNDRAQRDPDIWESMERIFRAALDKEGNDDE